MLRVLLTHLSDLLALDCIRGLHTSWFPGKDVLNGEDLIEELELLFGDFLVHVVDQVAIELVNVLESVNDETFQNLGIQDLVVIYEKLI